MNPGKPPQSNEKRFWDLVNRTETCWIWTGTRRPQGYGRFQEYRGTRREFGKNRHRLVEAHRFAFESLVGPIPMGLVLDHLCRNPSCVNPAHLEPVTQKENTRRGLRKDQRGELNVKAKLTRSDVSAIRRDAARGETRTSIAQRYGVHQATVSKIVLGQSWRHLDSRADAQSHAV